MDDIHLSLHLRGGTVVSGGLTVPLGDDVLLSSYLVKSFFDVVILYRGIVKSSGFIPTL